jgi:hypothetical protein
MAQFKNRTYMKTTHLLLKRGIPVIAGSQEFVIAGIQALEAKMNRYTTHSPYTIALVGDWDTRMKLASTIASFALEHYEAGGWDVVVECWTTEEIDRHLQECNAHTKWDAVCAFRDITDVWAEKQADARNSAW